LGNLFGKVNFCKTFFPIKDGAYYYRGKFTIPTGDPAKVSSKNGSFPKTLRTKGTRHRVRKGPGPIEPLPKGRIPPELWGKIFTQKDFALPFEFARDSHLTGNSFGAGPWKGDHNPLEKRGGPWETFPTIFGHGNFPFGRSKGPPKENQRFSKREDLISAERSLTPIGPNLGEGPENGPRKVFPTKKFSPKKLFRVFTHIRD